MITRPLDLASRLRPPPRNFDALFYVNVGALGLFFVLFGSRFVLSPGLGVEFNVPQMDASMAGAAATDVVIAITRTDMALVEGAVLDFAGLSEWLAARGAERPGRRLLVQADASVTAQDMARVYAMAEAAGFAGVVMAADPASPGRTGSAQPGVR